MAQALRADRGRGKLTRLLSLLGRYAEAIEADFARWYPGQDARFLWQSRQWRKLLNLIDRLPRNSHLVAAIAGDEELAQSMMRDDDDNDDRKPVRPSLVEWSPERDEIAKLGDRIGILIDAVVASAGGKPLRIPASDRPETAAERIRRERDEQFFVETHNSLVAQLLPNKDG